VKPLSVYRTEELARSHVCFFGADRSYHEARRRFVYKLGAPCAVTPPAAAPAPVGFRAVVAQA
jgi:putative two-component system hydrogenase maturation factor HypX/HoxX